MLQFYFRLNCKYLLVDRVQIKSFLIWFSRELVNLNVNKRLKERGRGEQKKKEKGDERRLGGPDPTSHPPAKPKAHHSLVREETSTIAQDPACHWALLPSSHSSTTNERTHTHTHTHTYIYIYILESMHAPNTLISQLFSR